MKWSLRVMLPGVLLFAVLAGAFLVFGVVPNRAAFDSKLYHLPTIQQFAATWPAIDPWDYLSATTPGYHWLLAGVARATGSTLAALVASSIVSIGLVSLLGWMIARLGRGDRDGWGIGNPSVPERGAGLMALLLVPVACNNYVLLPGVSFLPDGAGWLCVVLMLALALCAPSRGVLLVGGGLVLVLTVLTRQLHVWTGGLLVLALWLGVGVGVGVGHVRERRGTDGGLVTRAKRGLWGVGACVPAGLVLVLFVRYWEGLVPPRFQGQYPPKGVLDLVLSPSLAFVLAVCGALGVFFVGFWWAGVRGLWRERAWVVVVAVVGGLALACIPPTSFDYLAGRRTGLWNIAAHGPVVFGRSSVLIVGLAGLGAFVLAGFIALVPRRVGLVLLASLLGYGIVLSASAEVWQRYVEPLCLFVLTLLAAGAHGRAMTADNEQRWVRLAKPWGLVLLALACGAVTLRTFEAGLEGWEDAPPPAITADHVGPTPPVLLEAPEKPVGKSIW